MSAPIPQKTPLENTENTPSCAMKITPGQGIMVIGCAVMLIGYVGLVLSGLDPKLMHALGTIGSIPGTLVMTGGGISIALIGIIVNRCKGEASTAYGSQETTDVTITAVSENQETTDVTITAVSENQETTDVTIDIYHQGHAQNERIHFHIKPPLSNQSAPQLPQGRFYIERRGDMQWIVWHDSKTNRLLYSSLFGNTPNDKLSIQGIREALINVHDAYEIVNP